jgi:arylsulfatase A-like enzyme
VTCRAEARPNIVVFLADDQGWGDLPIHGNIDLATPQIDSLAQHGAAFDRFFVCPVCAPTRAECLTGRFAARTGVRGVTRGEERLNADETTIAQVFRAAGYATGILGKWHNGSQPPYHPNPPSRSMAAIWHPPGPPATAAARAVWNMVPSTRTVRSSPIGRPRNSGSPGTSFGFEAAVHLAKPRRKTTKPMKPKTWIGVSSLVAVTLALPAGARART